MKNRNGYNEIKGDIGFIDEMLGFLDDHRIDCTKSMLNDWKNGLIELAEKTTREGK